MSKSKPTPQKLFDRLEEQFRTLALALPEAHEQETWGHPTYRVRKKIFAIRGDPRDDGTTSVSMKAPPGNQEILLDRGHPFFYPSYVGSKGWIGVTLDADTDWQEIAELTEDAYRAIAPNKLLRQLDEAAQG